MENSRKITEYEMNSSLDKEGLHIYTQIKQPIRTFKLLGLIGEVMQEDGPILKKLETLRALTGSVYGLKSKEDLMRVQGTGLFYEKSREAKGYNYSPARILTVGESLVALAEPAKEILEKHNNHVFDTIEELESCLHPSVAVSVCGIVTGIYDTREHVAWKRKNVPRNLNDLFELIPLVKSDTTIIKGKGPIIEARITEIGSSSDFPSLGIGIVDLIAYHAQKFGPLSLDDLKKEMEKICYGEWFNHYVYDYIPRDITKTILEQNLMPTTLEELKEYALKLYNLNTDKEFFYEYFIEAFNKKVTELINQGKTLFTAFKMAAKTLNMQAYPSFLLRYETSVVDASKAIEYYIMRQLKKGKNILAVLEKLRKKLPVPDDERTNVQIMDIGLQTYKYARSLLNTWELIKGRMISKFYWEDVGIKHPILTRNDFETIILKGEEVLEKLRSKHPEEIPYEPRIKTFIEN